MSVLHVGVEAWGASGDLFHTGMGKYTENLVRGLAADPGVRVTTYGAPQEPRPSWLPEAAAWKAVGTRLGRLTAITTRLRALPVEVAADGVDLFHVPGLHVRPSFPPVARTQCPLVVTVHDLIPLNHYGGELPSRLRSYFRWNLDRALRADALVTVSEASRQEIERSLDRLPPVAVIPNAVAFPPNWDSGTVSRLGLAEPYLLYAGSYEPRKNLGRTLDAFALVIGEGFPHQLVAVVERSSGHAAPLLRRLTEAPLAGRVKLVHNLSEADLRALYTHAEALLFPSLAEGFGLPAAQGAACGVPVVASRLPALVELLEDCAIYVDPLRPDSIAKGIREVLVSSELRRRLAKAGPPRVAAYSVAASTKRHLDLYHSVLSHTRVTA